MRQQYLDGTLTGFVLAVDLLVSIAGEETVLEYWSIRSEQPYLEDPFSKSAIEVAFSQTFGMTLADFYELFATYRADWS
jgi:hypothetical protein